MRPTWMIALLALVALAGCLDNDSDTSPEPSAPLPSVTDLPCEASNLGQGTTDNLRMLSHVAFEDAYSRDIDIAGDLVLSPGGNGLGIIDLSNPSDLGIVSELRQIGGELDVKFTPDNQTALLGGGNGIILVDIQDPANPYVQGYWNFSQAPGAPDLIQDPINTATLNAHMIYSERIAGEDWVFLAPNSNSGVWILKLLGEPGNRSLEWVAQTMPLQGSALGPHDMWVTYDTHDEAWLLYSADSFEGWTVFNVDNPETPQLVGGLIRPETGYTHTIQAEWIGDRRIVATIQEVGVSTLEIYDATNLMAPVLLATWVESATEAAQPQHNIQMVNGTLWMAHYSRGVFAFDLTSLGAVPGADTATLTPVAHYDPEIPHGGPTLDFSGVYDVVIHEGLVYISSYTGDLTGVASFAYGCYTPGDVLLTSTG